MMMTDTRRHFWQDPDVSAVERLEVAVAECADPHRMSHLVADAFMDLNWVHEVRQSPYSTPQEPQMSIVYNVPHPTPRRGSALLRADHLLVWVRSENDLSTTTRTLEQLGEAFCTESGRHAQFALILTTGTATKKFKRETERRNLNREFGSPDLWEGSIECAIPSGFITPLHSRRRAVASSGDARRPRCVHILEGKSIVRFFMNNANYVLLDDSHA